MSERSLLPGVWASSARQLIFAALIGAFAWSPAAWGANSAHNMEDHEHEMAGERLHERETAQPLRRKPRKATAMELRELQPTPDEESTVPEVPLPPRPHGAHKLYGATCTIAFRDQTALTILPDNARFTFATPPWYIEGCGGGWFHLLENSTRYQEAFRSSYGHYHLGWDGFCLVPSSGKPGKMNGGTCVEVDPVRQDRFVNPHQPDEWLRGYVYKRGVPELSFDLLEIRVRNAPVQVWVRKTAGNWLTYNLAVGYWALQQADDIREILISGQRGSGIWEIDDVKIRVPWS
jgi:hypothetical protein